MGLAEFYAAIGPYLEGHATLADARARVYGAEADSVAAARLAIYGRFCRIHRVDAVRIAYPETVAIVEKAGGRDALLRLVDEFFEAHPMHHTELCENTAAMPEFLREHAARLDLPPYLAAVAEVEWWEWRSQFGADHPDDADPDSGPLRLGATVEVRPLAYDVVEWLDVPSDERPDAPEQSEVYVLHWRDRDLDARRGNASVVELLVLKAVSEGIADVPDGVDEEAWRETFDDLREAGVLLGAATP